MGCVIKTSPTDMSAHNLIQTHTLILCTHKPSPPPHHSLSLSHTHPHTSTHTHTKFSFATNKKCLMSTQCFSDLPDLASLNRSMKPLNARNKIAQLGYEPMSARNQALEPFRKPSSIESLIMDFYL